MHCYTYPGLGRSHDGSIPLLTPSGALKYQPTKHFLPLFPPRVQNVLLTASGDRAKLADVGMAGLLDAGSLHPGELQRLMSWC